MAKDVAQMVLSPQKTTLCLTGAWTVAELTAVQKKLHDFLKSVEQVTAVDASGIQAMDSAGALLLFELIKKVHQTSDIEKITLSGLKPRYETLLNLVTKEAEYVTKPVHLPKMPNWFYQVGVWFTVKLWGCFDFFAFIGRVVHAFRDIIRVPKRMYWKGVVQAIDETGYQALPIVALLSFLVGVVVTYQIALQLETYGANIYVVDLAGMIILREFGPLITAIIAAGRTSTAFTAQLGTMKVNEELDALNTMGITPEQRLVVPKIVGLTIALPLVAVWANIFGVLGAMLIAKTVSGINYHAFLDRFQQAISVRHYIVGLIKVPVFALLIANVGCYQGFQVAFSADSVGQKTTQSAVQSIFLIIIADALFSVIYSWRGV